MNNFIKEFKEFAMRGNVIDMAVGFVIGTAFGKISTSLVSDMIMPSLGVVMGDIDLSHYSITLKKAVGTLPAVTLNYGAFLNTILDFVIVALAMFVAVKAMNHLKRKEAVNPTVTPPPPSKEEILLTEIRDLLRQKQG